MSCDVGKATEGLENENPVTYEKRKKDWRMSFDVGEAMEGLENEVQRR